MRLEDINLEEGGNNFHHELILENHYLCLIGGEYWIGHFTRYARGLIFHGWHDMDILYEKPGIKDSLWNKVYRMVETTDEHIFALNQSKPTLEYVNRKLHDSAGNFIIKYTRTY